MRSPIAIVVVMVAAISLATPAQADACLEYRLALAARDAAYRLTVDALDEGFVGEKPEFETLLKLRAEASSRLIEARRALRNTLSDDAAAATIDSLSALDALSTKTMRAMADWVGIPDDPPDGHLFFKLLTVDDAISQAQETAFKEVCP